MKNLLIVSAMVLSFFSMSRAHSDILVEPYVGGHFFGSGYESGSSSTDITGMAYGARVGWQSTGLMVGGNFKTGSFKADETGFSDIDSYTNMGAFVGYNFPVMIRVWAEYILSSSMETDTGFEIEKGSGTTFGIGLTNFPLISINLEYSTTDGYKNKVAGTDNNLEFSTMMLSVSLPFTF